MYSLSLSFCLCVCISNVVFFIPSFIIIILLHMMWWSSSSLNWLEYDYCQHVLPCHHHHPLLTLLLAYRSSHRHRPLVFLISCSFSSSLTFYHFDLPSQKILFSLLSSLEPFVCLSQTTDAKVNNEKIFSKFHKHNHTYISYAYELICILPLKKKIRKKRRLLRTNRKNWKGDM